MVAGLFVQSRQAVATGLFTYVPAVSAQLTHWLGAPARLKNPAVHPLPTISTSATHQRQTKKCMHSQYQGQLKVSAAVFPHSKYVLLNCGAFVHLPQSGVPGVSL